MLRSLDRSPRCVASFVLFLVLAQLYAFGLQFARGFRPFVHEPGRVPLSWDMFANKLERCVLSWTPAIPTPAGTISSLKELGTGVEWDIVYDRASDYEMIEKWVCSSVYLNGGIKISRHCFFPNGTETRHENNCR